MTFSSLNFLEILFLLIGFPGLKKKKLVLFSLGQTLMGQYTLVLRGWKILFTILSVAKNRDLKVLRKRDLTLRTPQKNMKSVDQRPQPDITGMGMGHSSAIRNRGLSLGSKFSLSPLGFSAFLGASTLPPSSPWLSLCGFYLSSSTNLTLHMGHSHLSSTGLLHGTTDPWQFPLEVEFKFSREKPASSASFKPGHRRYRLLAGFWMVSSLDHLSLLINFGGGQSQMV